MKFSPRASVTLVFCAFGALLGTHLGAIPFLVKASALSSFEFGLIAAMGMLCNILGMGLGGIVNRHFDHRTVLLVMLPVGFILLCLALLANSLWFFAGSFMAFNYVLGTTDLFMNAEGGAVEQEMRRPVFNGFHGAAMLVIGVSAIVSSIVSAQLAPWCSALITFFPVLLAWISVRDAIVARPVSRAPEGSKRVPLPYGILTVLGLAAGFNVACEVAAMQWAGQLLASLAPGLAAYSGLGVSFYALCGGSMRMIGDRLRGIYGDAPVLIVGVLVGIAGFIVLGLASDFWISVLAFATVGCGLSLVFPCLFALAGTLAPRGKAAAMGYVAAIGGVPRVVLPWLLGMLATELSLNAVFMACAAGATVALALIIATFRKVERFL